MERGNLELKTRFWGVFSGCVYEMDGKYRQLWVNVWASTVPCHQPGVTDQSYGLVERICPTLTTKNERVNSHAEEGGTYINH